MSAPMIRLLLQKSQGCNVCLIIKNLSKFSTSSCLQAGAKWRLSKGLPANQNQYGPLTDLPDWSYLDGRPTPIGHGQKRRLEKNVEYGKQILTHLEDIGRAERMYEAKIKDAKERRQKIIDHKLKPKGNQLKKKS